MEHVKGRKFTEKNKVEEIHLTNLATLGDSQANKSRIHEQLDDMATTVISRHKRFPFKPVCTS